MNLTSEDYWEENWKSIKLPRLRNMQNYSMQAMEKVLKKYLPRGRKKFLELGAAPASWLIYFKQRFNYDITGIDYSPYGSKLSKKNMQMAKVKGKVIVGDIFKHNLKKNSYDIVFSFGLIEHFEQPLKVVKIHADLAKKNGLVVVCIPNFHGIPKAMQWVLSRDVLKSHNIMTKEDISSLLKKAGLKEVYVNYIGKFNIDNVNPGAKSKFGKKRYEFEPVLKFSVKVLSGILRIPPHWESKYTSPYVIGIGKKS